MKLTVGLSLVAFSFILISNSFAREGGVGENRNPEKSGAGPYCHFQGMKEVREQVHPKSVDSTATTMSARDISSQKR